MGLSINVKKEKLNRMEFLINYLKDNQNIEVLDLSNNNIGNKGVTNITKLLEHNTNITEVNLSDNNIGTKGLNHLCSALSCNTSVRYLDIKRNPVPWGANKVLLALLYKNPYILDIRYSKYDEEGKEYSESINEEDAEAQHFERTHIRNMHTRREEPKRSWFQRWCWCICKSFSDAKVESFRFKYDSQKLIELENSMDSITWILYINAVLFYFICIFFPIIFAGGCGGGINIWSHIIYTVYAIINFIGEFWIVLKIQKQLDNPDLLKLNKWHFGKCKARKL